MKIGLVRHFKVDAPYIEGKVTAKEFTGWMKEYDDIEVIPTEVDLKDIEWNKCYCSDLYRARITAKTIYGGEIIESPLIKEVDLTFTKEFQNSVDRKVPFLEWSLYSMMSWAKSSHIVTETIDESRDRVDKFLRQLFEVTDIENNVLLVCHGMIMTILDEELKKRGFKGDTVVSALNGELFLYERK